MHRVRVVPLLLILAMLLPLGSVQAQRIRRSLDIPRPDWGLEASFSGLYNDFSFEQVNDHLEQGPEYYTTSGPAIDGYQDQSSFEATTAIDIRFGGRYRGVRFGGGFTNQPDQSGGFSLYQENLAGQIVQTIPYSLELSTREFYGYAGYLHPVTRRIEIGVVGSFGLGFVEGTLTDDVERSDANGVSVNGNYTPICVEALTQINVTRYLALHVKAGMRWANSTDTEADYGVDGVSGISGSTGPIIDYQDQVMEMDFSGWYVGGGLTLKNPFDGR